LLRPFLAAGLLELAPDLQLPGTDRKLSVLIDSAAVASLTAMPEFTRELKESLG